MPRSYDFIIVGAGSAGCVLAHRLSADPSHRVLLVEAGPRDWNPVFRVPIMAGRLYTQAYCNWGFETEPEPFLNGRRIPWPRGRVLGGSSSINGMIYTRGNRYDYDGWAQMGLLDWSYDKVLDAFRRSERHHGGPSEFHGGDGPLPVGPATSSNPLFDAFVQAGLEAGYPFNPDFNGAEQEGVGRYDYNIWRGQRWSSARSFLDPIRGRPNLEILTGAQLLKVVIDKGRATGVRLRTGADEVVAHADGEVILSAGAVGSPMGLMHSGIGDPDALAAVGIRPLVESGGVGQNLQDHFHVMVAHRSKTADTTYDHLRFDKAATGFVQAALFGNGPFSRFPHEGGAFLKVDPDAPAPQVQIHFFAGGAGGVRHPFNPRPWTRFGPGYTFYGSVCQLRPESVGELTLKSDDPVAPPVIRANYLSTPGDRRIMREGVRIMRDIFAQPAFEAHRGAELLPDSPLTTDAEIDAFVAANGSTIFHPVGTCRMGADPGSVVDEELRVRGVDGLRVADASAMPRLVSSNTHAPTVMIAEKAAGYILGQASAARSVSARTNRAA